jgi:exodeoxyribonuclease-3
MSIFEEIIKKPTNLRVVSFNANGIRSAHTKGFFDWLSLQKVDILCVQELKADAQVLKKFSTTPCGLSGFFMPAQKKGYSGVAIYTKSPPTHVDYGCQLPEFDDEGRCITAHYDQFIVVSIYFPSGSSGEDRQEAKFRFLDQIEPFFQNLKEQKKPVIVCGDVNIAHQNIDIKNWKSNQKNSGFLPEEREWLTRLFHSGWQDTFRYLNQEADQYTWWSQRGRAREKNVGWRIDYQLTDLKSLATPVFTHIENRVIFSDHAPLIIDYQF